MIPALAIICCVITALAIATALLAYACVRVGSKPYPTKPGTCTHENKDLT